MRNWKFKVFAFMVLAAVLAIILAPTILFGQSARLGSLKMTDMVVTNTAPFAGDATRTISANTQSWTMVSNGTNYLYTVGTSNVVSSNRVTLLVTYDQVSTEDFDLNASVFTASGANWTCPSVSSGPWTLIGVSATQYLMHASDGTHSDATTLNPTGRWAHAAGGNPWTIGLAYNGLATNAVPVTNSTPIQLTTGSGSALTGITSAQVGAVATNDAHYLASLTNAAAFDAAGAAAAVTTSTIGAVPAARTISVNGTVGTLTSNLSFTTVCNVASVFGRTGVVVATSGDYTAAQVGAVSTSGVSSIIYSNPAAFDPAGSWSNVTAGSIGAATTGTVAIVATTATNAQTAANAACATTATHTAQISALQGGVATWNTVTAKLDANGNASGLSGCPSGAVPTTDARYLATVTNGQSGVTLSNVTLTGTVTLTNSTSFSAGKLNGTNGVFWTAPNATNYWILFP